MADNLQKIVVLCAIVLMGFLGWYLFGTTNIAEAPATGSGDDKDTSSQIDPPSLDIDAGPSDGPINPPPTDGNYYPTEIPDSSSPVTSFIECVAAGNPVMESYPRQCRHNGELFVEEVNINDQSVACTADAKICPNGSAVGRVGPNCEFAACPGEGSEEIVCTPESKQVDACIEIYAPVCGLVEVQCVTTPCPPIPETFSNSCHACAQGNVISYTEGACEVVEESLPVAI